MKTKLTSLLFMMIFTLGLLSLQGCFQDDCKGQQTYIQYTPIWKTVEEYQIDAKADYPRTLENPSGLYFYNNYILINERNKGIHVINNQDPKNPQNITFISIEGNTSMAVRGDMLYANNYLDLLSIDIKDILNPKQVKRVEFVFKPISQNTNDNTYLLYYDETEITETIDCNDPNWGRTWFSKGSQRDDIFVSDAVSVLETGSSFDQNGNSLPAGVGGSMARFTLAHDHLYTVDESTLNIFNLDNISCPEKVNEVNLGWGIETIFPYEQNLFIGANNGMHIYSANDPENPIHRSTFSHATACDPVVISGNRAYVTLRDGTNCQNFNNQLDVVDISNLDNPQLIETYQMHNPHGLSVKGNTLFLCDGSKGLKVYDISDEHKIDKNLLDRKKDFFAYDAIALSNDIVLVIGKDGFYQYDASNPKNLKELSVISVFK